MTWNRLLLSLIKQGNKKKQVKQTLPDKKHRTATNTSSALKNSPCQEDKGEDL